MNDLIIDKLIKESKKANKYKDIPIACIITKDDKIVSKAYNQKVKNNDPLAHAEIIAIRKACKKLNTYNLTECKLYTTLYPCNMCKEVIKESRIKEVYYILDSEKTVKDSTKYIKINNVPRETLIDNYKKELKYFFKSMR